MSTCAISGSSAWLANARVDVDWVMAPYVGAAVAKISATGQTLVLMIDQTQVSARHQVLMVSLRAGGRALPVAWRVRQTKGAIGVAGKRFQAARIALPPNIREAETKAGPAPP